MRNRKKKNSSLNRELFRLYRDLFPNEESCRKVILEARVAHRYLKKSDPNYLEFDFDDIKWEEDL